MPTLTPPTSSQSLIKMFLLGISGTGKTWAYSYLGIPDIIPGWKPLKLRIFDFDGKDKAREVIESVLNLLLHKKEITKSQYTAAFANYDVCNCLERNLSVVTVREGNKTVKRPGFKGGLTTAWKDAVNQMEIWDREGWDSSHVLIVDSFKYAIDALANAKKELTNTVNKPLVWQQYGDIQSEIADFLRKLAPMDSHVLVTAHQEPLEIYRATERKDEEGKPIQEMVESLILPISIGKAGRVQLPAGFNHMLLCHQEGSGANVRRVISTAPARGVITKTPFYGRCKPTYSIDKGLVEYFKLGVTLCK